MLFNSAIFVGRFLPICLAGFFGLGWLGGRRAALCWLVGASLFFYGWWNPPFVLLLVGSIIANYCLGQMLLRGEGRRIWVLRAGVAMDLLVLGVFKYSNFFLQTARQIGHFDAPTLHLFLPLAISFFTFQQIMFLVDSHRGQRDDAGFLPYATFISFFPHLIAGPIVRPRDIIPQFLSSCLPRPDPDNLSAGLILFLLGLAKKLVIADTLAPIADAGFNAAANFHTLTMIEAWIATLAYGLQLYFDFSGYSDMAIGLARMMNIRFPLNFDSPYQAQHISDFWRRWHISLSNFLRDYVYIGLGGNRRGAARRNVNLLATMILGGLWHGAGWNFALWGGLHGSYLVGHRQWQRLMPPPANPGRLRRVLARSALLLAVMIAWVPFRAASFAATTSILASMAGLRGLTLSPFIVARLPVHWTFLHAGQVIPIVGAGRPLALPQCLFFIAAAGFGALAMPHVHRMRRRAQLIALTASFGLTMQALFFAPNVAPFLYFQF